MHLQAAENKLLALEPQPWPIPLGPLLEVVESAVNAMPKREWLFLGPRARAAAMLRGCPPERLLHTQNGARPYKVAPTSLDPAARALHAVGASIATQTHSLCILGNAAAGNGDFSEALNLASILDVPVIFLFIEQSLGDGAPVGIQHSGNIVDRVTAMGISCRTVNAKDAGKAIKEAHSHSGPTFLHFHLET